MEGLVLDRECLFQFTERPCGDDCAERITNFVAFLEDASGPNADDDEQQRVAA